MSSLQEKEMATKVDKKNNKDDNNNNGIGGKYGNGNNKDMITRMTMIYAIVGDANEYHNNNNDLDEDDNGGYKR